MDQQKSSAKSKNTIMKFLPTSSSVLFQNTPIYSPSKLHFKSHLGVGETRRRIKSISEDTVLYEPTSPRVSCMGQIKCKLNTRDKLEEKLASSSSKNESKGKKKLGGFYKNLLGRKNINLNLDLNLKQAPLYLDHKAAPISLGTMKRFSSGRSAAVVMGSDEESEVVIVPSSAPVMIRNTLGFDDKFVRVVGNTEPRKEINLWKRRTMEQPKPLDLHKI